MKMAPGAPSDSSPTHRFKTLNSIRSGSDTASSTHMLEVTLGFSPSSHHHAVTAMVWAPAITPDSSDASSSRVLFTAARDSTIRSWYAESNETLRPRSVMHGHSGWITDLIYIASHHRLASCSLDRRVKIWHPDDGRCFNVHRSDSQSATDFKRFIHNLVDRLVSGTTTTSMHLHSVRTRTRFFLPETTARCCNGVWKANNPFEISHLVRFH
jgi:WD40 repeat protein